MTEAEKTEISEEKVKAITNYLSNNCEKCFGCPYDKGEYCDKDSLFQNAADLVENAMVHNTVTVVAEASANTSLTIDQLKAINKAAENQTTKEKQWVWVQFLTDKNGGYYQAHYDSYFGSDVFSYGYPGFTYGLFYLDYGKSWLAYKYQPNESDKK